MLCNRFAVSKSGPLTANRFLRACANGSDGSDHSVFPLHLGYASVRCDWDSSAETTQLVGRRKERHKFEQKVAVLAPLALIRRHLSKPGAPSTFFPLIFFNSALIRGLCAEQLANCVIYPSLCSHTHTTHMRHIHGTISYQRSLVITVATAVANYQ